MTGKQHREATFEEVMFTLISATQDTLKMYLDLDVYSGKVERKVAILNSDVVAVVGLAGSRVGYVIITADSENAQKIARKMMMCEEVNPEETRDAFGELVNNIAGVFKSKYFEEYGQVSLGLPLIVSGSMKPMADVTSAAEADDDKTITVQSKGVTIPFFAPAEGLSLQVMFYM